nr:hypothetical protein CFP56_03942 [Quercus suber]
MLPDEVAYVDSILMKQYDSSEPTLSTPSFSQKLQTWHANTPNSDAKFHMIIFAYNTLRFRDLKRMQRPHQGDVASCAEITDAYNYTYSKCLLATWSTSMSVRTLEQQLPVLN